MKVARASNNFVNRDHLGGHLGLVHGLAAQHGASLYQIADGPKHAAGWFVCLLIVMTPIVIDRGRDSKLRRVRRRHQHAIEYFGLLIVEFNLIYPVFRRNSRARDPHRAAPSAGARFEAFFSG